MKSDLNTENPEEISSNWYWACPLQLKKCYHCSLWKADLMHLIEFPLLDSKLDASQIANCYIMWQLKFRQEKLQKLLKCPPYVCTKIVKIGWFWLRYWKNKRWMFLLRHSVEKLNSMLIPTWWNYSEQSQLFPRECPVLLTTWNCTKWLLTKWQLMLITYETVLSIFEVPGS